MNNTKDGVEVVTGMTVYAISPWGEIETVYVDDNLVTAYTCFPEDPSASCCWHPVENCYSSREAVESAIKELSYCGNCGAPAVIAPTPRITFCPGCGGEEF